MAQRIGIQRLIRPAIVACTILAATPVVDASDEQFGIVSFDSVARRWNDVLLESIRRDQARPVVHARNLFHVSAAMWDAWAMFDQDASPWLHAESAPTVQNLGTFRNHVIAHAAYGLVTHRFQNSPGFGTMSGHYDDLMIELGCDPTDSSLVGSTAAAIGNRIAASYVLFGLSDGLNEAANYANQWYEPINDPLLPPLSGTQAIEFPDRWQPLSLDYYVDQSGHVDVNGYPEFLGPEWGHVTPFSLTVDQRTDYHRDGNTYPVYVDPGAPPRLDPAGEQAFLEGFEQVLHWSAHLDPVDGVMMDASPASIGNATLPVDPFDVAAFYDVQNGGDLGAGHASNPVTGAPYDVQMVPRADYARVLAEFWADGPDSETPPGHWFAILNDVMDHPSFERRLEGTGPVLGRLEYDVKAYFALGGCMHDAAISAWGAKGWYDYVRPISVIRWMAENGQRTDANAANYHPRGLRLIAGLVETITDASSAPGERHEHLRGFADANLGRIAVQCWRGPDYIGDPESTLAGVGWILAEDWWPYQRPTFVTPNFAGYVSGHSTFSRAAAELLTRLTGSPWFPGGMGEYVAHAGEFLVFEDGPSVDVRLQWATYRDASDQCSLSRIWGGIHPPADDLPGRMMGIVIGPAAWDHATTYFDAGGSCDADFNQDGSLDGGDLAMLLADWGQSGPGVSTDLDQDGVVGPGDLGIFLSSFGSSCP